MAKIRGKDTRPELEVRRRLHALGYRFRLHAAGLPGRPDLVFHARQKVLFVHGCFWHGHNCTHGRRRPSTRSDFWRKKMGENQARDARRIKELRKLGWRSKEIWECEIKNGSWLVKATRFLGKLGASPSLVGYRLDNRQESLKRSDPRRAAAGRGRRVLQDRGGIRRAR